MVTVIESMVEVPALQDGRKVIIPAFRISTDIDNWGAKALDVYKQAPTLAQLRHADAISDVIRQNIRYTRRYRGEFLADFVDYNAQKPKGTRLSSDYLFVHLYQRPDNVVERNGVGVAEGKPVGVELPPNGWQVSDGDLLYNPETGLPIKTVNDRVKAINELSRIMPREQAEREVSYFWRFDENHQRLSPVSRLYGWTAVRGPFDVHARWHSPLPSGPSVGSRVVRNVAQKVYVLDENEYRKVVEELGNINSVSIGKAQEFAITLLGILSKAEVREEQR